MPKGITHLPVSITQPLDQIEPSKAKVKVMTAEIHRRVLENQDMLAMVKDPKSLDKRDAKKYEELQKSEKILNELLTKKEQFYAQKKDLKAKIPTLAKELETQKENFKIYKQKDKLAAAEKALKVAQKDYAQVRKDLRTLNDKITTIQVKFNVDSFSLRKVVEAKTSRRPVLSAPIYPEATRQKIEKLFRSLPPLSDIHQEYENVMSDSEEFHDSILTLMTQISESGEELDITPQLETLLTLITKEKAEIEKNPTRKERAEKILQERSGMLMDDYLSHVTNIQETRKEIGILQSYGILAEKYADIAHRSLDLFSPRLSYYAAVRDHLKQLHLITSNPFSPVLSGNQLEQLLQSLENINKKEEAYLAKDLCAQRVSSQIQSHHILTLSTEDDRLHKDKRMALDRDNIMLFEDIIAHKIDANAAYFDKKLRQIFTAYKETHQAASPYYYEKIQEILTVTLATDEYAKNYQLNEMCNKLQNAMGIDTDSSNSSRDYKKRWGYKEVVERSFSPNDYLLKPKVAKERFLLQLQLLKQKNPEWAKNILFFENNILPLLNIDQKKKLKELLQYYPQDSSKTEIHQKMYDILSEWAHNPMADPNMRLTQLNSLLADSVHHYTITGIPPLTIPLFQEDVEAYVFSESS